MWLGPLVSTKECDPNLKPGPKYSVYLLEEERLKLAWRSSIRNCMESSDSSFCSLIELEGDVIALDGAERRV